MWLIMGFRDVSSADAPEPFFVGIFQEHYVANEICKRLNKEKKDDAFYEIKQIQQNKVYDYEWNVMDEDDYNQMQKNNLNQLL
jgi:hypothetical protein